MHHRTIVSIHLAIPDNHDRIRSLRAWDAAAGGEG